MLSVRDLHVTFGSGDRVVHAVNGVDLAVQRGEVVGLVGETGSGKTVTSLSILGLVQPPGVVTSGRIRTPDGGLHSRQKAPAVNRPCVAGRAGVALASAGGCGWGSPPKELVR